MNSKELILKRLLENKHITIEEMFILNQNDNPISIVEIKDLNPFPRWQEPHRVNPYWYTTITCKTTANLNEATNYKMD